MNQPYLVFVPSSGVEPDVVVKLLDQIAQLVNRTSKGIWLHENLKRNHTDDDPNFKLAPNTDDAGERKSVSDLIFGFEMTSASHELEEDKNAQGIPTHWEYRYPRGPNDKGNKKKIKEADVEVCGAW
jgi:hypothetical protein